MAFKFRHKVLLAFSGLALLALALFLSITLWRLQTSAELRVRQSLENARDAFFRSRQQQAEAVADAIGSIANTNPELRAVLASSDDSGVDPFASSAKSNIKPSAERLQVLESTLPFLPIFQHSSQFAVFDRNGAMVLVKDPEQLKTLGSSVPTVVSEALKGDNSYDWWPGPTKLQVFASPVVVQSGTVGVILVGYPINRALLDPLAKISKTDIAIAENQSDPDEIAVKTREGQSILTGIVPILGKDGRRVGAFEISRSLDEEMRDAHALRNQLIALGAAILLLSAAVALYFAALVSRPLETLGQAVKEVGAGNFAHRVKYQARDEFGTLGKLINEMAAGLEERERIRATFNRYVDDEVVSEILKTHGAASFDGDEREISVLFADLANFTAFSEGKTPKQLLAELNGYFASMAKVIEEQKGILDKFIGDAVMAYWGAPAINTNHAQFACRSALQQRLRFQTDFAPLYPKLGLRIGVSSGRALVGNVGSERRQNYTVMGDTVNLASRLEGVNKAFGTVICVSEEARANAGPSFVFRRLGKVRVAGRDSAESVYELIAEGAVDAIQEEILRNYAKTLELFEKGDFPGAVELATPLAEKGDKPSMAILARSLDKRKHDRRDGAWEGLWILGK